MGLSNHIILKKDRSIKESVRVFLSELISTFLFVMVGVATCFMKPWIKPLDNTLLLISFGLGFAVLVGMQFGAGVSGGHINPVVSLAAFILGKLALLDLLIYVIAQFSGSFLGYLVIWPMQDNEKHESVLEESTFNDSNYDRVWNYDIWSNFNYTYGNNITKNYYNKQIRDNKIHKVDLCYPSINENIYLWQGFLVEIIAGFILATVACGVFDSRCRSYVGTISLKFAFVVVAEVLAFGQFTMCIMNPARSLAQATFNKDLSEIWIYLVGPLIGCIAAALLYRLAWALPYSEEMGNKEE